MTATKYYVICSSPRSGSTLVAQALAVMGVGNPGEFLNPSLMHEEEWGGPDKFMKPTPREYIERLMREQTRNGVFGIKVHYVDLVRWPDIFDNMAQLFPDAKYISITRRNVLRQAVSAARAAQTMAYTSHEQDRKSAKFNYLAVLKHIITTLREIEWWDRFYAAHNVKPLRIMYEDLDDNYEQTMRSVLTFLGVDGSIPAPPLKKQSDATTESWVERFNGYFRGRRITGRVVRLISRRW